ncbi:YraN family protein [Mobilicoccus massiliensis]|uniref:YraN family protein n=1 Tax=Mobilicoccus massiliensis TaxID=1522310 RepID=UPI00058D9638|nr:YraN family protein [Mobilicoccus massiliensis]
MTDGRRALGEYGERLAARYLREAGLVVLDHNWRCEVGEIDLVARQDDCLVVCEVKTRRRLDFGGPAAAVTPVKAARLRRLAGCWIEEHPDTGTHDVRIDVIAVMRPIEGPARVEHLVAVA